MQHTRTGIVFTLALLVGASISAAQSAQIQTIEITQSIGVQLNGALKFVAGKDTVIRAILSAPVTVDSAATSAAITRDGAPVATLTPNNYEAPVSAVDFQCPTRAACGEWAAGRYVFDVTVNGSTRSTSGTTYAFVERSPVRVLAVPVKANYNGQITQVSGDGWKTMGAFTRDTYPVGRDQFRWAQRPELDASASKYNLETDDGRLELWQALANLMPAHCAATPRADDCYDKIVGFISDRPSGYPNGTLQGYTYGSPANIVVASDEDAAATVAHEVAHTFTAGDTYDGGKFHCSVNPSPDAFSGKDWDDHNRVIRCSAGRAQLPGVSATLVPSEAHAYDVGGRGLLGNMADFMGSGGKQAQFWITPDVFDQIFTRSAPSAPQAAVAVTGGAALPPPQRFIEFFGMIREDAASAADIELEPWESFVEAIEVPDTTGPLMIAAVDSTRRRLATRALDVEFDIPGMRGAPPLHVNPAPFDGAMRFPAGTAVFQFIRNDRVIREIDVSPNAPVVSAVTPTSRSVVNGNYVIRWTAVDADGDSMTFSVEYNADVTKADSDWITLAEDLEDPFWQEDFGELGGGDHARLRVKANDGFNTASAQSAEFSVPAKAPELFVQELAATTILQGQELVLAAESFDLQDDELTGSSLKWTSSLSGAIGTGSPVVAKNLPVGEHVITLVGTNSMGLSDTDSVTIKVVPGRRRIPR